jgi:hypothetical protein
MRFLVAVLATTLAVPATAGTVESEVCRRDLFQARGALSTTQDNLTKAITLPKPEQCAAYRKHVERMKYIILIHERCLSEPERKTTLAENFSSLREFEGLLRRDCRGL